MLLFRKMLHCKEGSWLASVSAEKIDRSPIVLGASGASAFPHAVLVHPPETKTPVPGTLPIQTASAAQVATGTRDRDRSRLNRLRNLADKVDVREPALQPRAFGLDMLGELVVTLEGARSNAAVAKPR